MKTASACSIRDRACTRNNTIVIMGDQSNLLAEPQSQVFVSNGNNGESGRKDTTPFFRRSHSSQRFRRHIYRSGKLLPRPVIKHHQNTYRKNSMYWDR